MIQPKTLCVRQYRSLTTTISLLRITFANKDDNQWRHIKTDKTYIEVQTKMQEDNTHRQKHLPLLATSHAISKRTALSKSNSSSHSSRPDRDVTERLRASGMLGRNKNALCLGSPLKLHINVINWTYSIQQSSLGVAAIHLRNKDLILKLVLCFYFFMKSES